MKKLYFLFVLLLQFGASAQVINFPDANFKNKLVNTNSVNFGANAGNDSDADI